MKYKTATFTLFTLVIMRMASAEYSYPVESDKHYGAMSIGEIGTYGSQCEKTSSFYLGLVLLQMIAIESGWNATEQTEQIRVVLEVSKTDEFKQGANRMYREGCDRYKQRLQPLVNDVLDALK